MSYESNTGKVNIRIGADGRTFGLVGHELKHAYQFEAGKISIAVDNKSYGKLYDLGDETEAYNRERMIGAGEDFYIKKLQWNNDNVKELGKSMSPAAYQTLPTNSIDINSPEGKQLILQSTMRVFFGKTPLEVFRIQKQSKL